MLRTRVPDWLVVFGFSLLVLSPKAAAELRLDETPAGPSDWGYRPAEGFSSDMNPPSFSWRPQQEVVAWELQCAAGREFGEPEYRIDNLKMNVHCPPRAFKAGSYRWRYRGVDADGKKTNWSSVRTFQISTDARELPMPPRGELLARIPRAHPRLFVRPEDLPRLRQMAKGEFREAYEALVEHCDRLLANPPPTAEPPKYGPKIVRGSDPWRKIWWGNREYTKNSLDGAATLAFAHRLGGKPEYGQLAKKILLECAAWDPKGSTGYRYNDEAGMPYAYYFSRTYTFVYDLLNDEERETCRQVMLVRGREMYDHLYPRHLWQPYSSHSNRAWHFLGEVGIAFLGELEEAEDWVWFAMNVFFNVYPVWSDEDGGWHEGCSYWSSYIGRFTWWADVMRSATGINAYDKPYFSRIGYYPMYLMPPGKTGGGFGDLTAGRRASQQVSLVSQLAAQAGNPHWQWYVEQMGGPSAQTGYVGYVRGMLPKVDPGAPEDLPASRLFRGTGQAVLNTQLDDAKQSVQVVFKSSPFGTQSHGYEANNSFLLWAYGRRLLVRSGYRDSYGSDHHRRWMWSTRSVNNITVGGQGQRAHSSAAQGEIVGFKTTRLVDLVAGEAGDTYRRGRNDPSALSRFTRTLVFVKPDLLVVYDQLAAREAAHFEYWLHATHEFAAEDQQEIRLEVDDVHCRISLLAPTELALTQTDQYDPNPRSRIKLREWHLTAQTPHAAKETEFVAVYQPYRNGETRPDPVVVDREESGYVLRASLKDGRALILLPTGDTTTLQADGVRTQGKVVVRRYGTDGSIMADVGL